MKPTLPAKLLNDLEPYTGHVSSIVTISGGITNRNYKLESEHGAFMLRIAGADSRGRTQPMERDLDRGSYEINHCLPIEVEIR